MPTYSYTRDLGKGATLTYSEPQEEKTVEKAKSNTILLVLGTIGYFSLYFAIMFAANNSTSTTAQDLLFFVLTILNIGLVLYALAFGLLLWSTINQFYRHAQRRI